MTSLSIITTVLNDEKNIQRCLNSVFQQKKDRKFEHVIVDGGSTDQTLNIIKNFKKKVRYIKFYKKNNFNIYQGINYGIKKSKNNIIGLLHSNDIFENKSVIRDVLKIFFHHPSLLALYSNVSIISKHNLRKEVRFFGSKNLSYKDFINGLHPPHTGLFVKRDIFIKYGNYNEKLKIASDFEFMLRVFGKYKVKAKYINKTFVVMTSGGMSNKNLINIVKSNYEAYRAYKINKLKFNILYIINKIMRKINQIRLNF